MNFATSDGTASSTTNADYTATSGTLTFFDGDTQETFEVAIIEDGVDEPDETVNLTLSNVTGGATLGSPSTAVLTLTDNDGPPTGGATCNGLPATITGTEGNDVLKGTSRVDVIQGLGGHDLIRGLKGNDLLCGGDGNDELRGGKQNDRLFGESGNELLKGDRDRDQLDGGADTDACSGGSGSDTAADCETTSSVP